MNITTLTTHDNYIAVTDLSLATTLSLNFPIINIDRTNKRRCSFQFEKRKDVERMIEAYWQDKLAISPNKFFQQLRVVKARLYDE